MGACSHEELEMSDHTLKASVKDSIGNLIETCDLAELYHTYAWKQDLWQNGFPEICRLERNIGSAVRTGTLSKDHLKAIAEWGGLKKIAQIEAATPIKIELFEDGNVAQWARDNPENAIRVLDRQIRGFGPTYTSKLLRFAAPKIFGAIDTRIVRVFGAGDTGPDRLHLLDLSVTPGDDGGWAINRDQSGWPEEYGTWIGILTYAASKLNAEGVMCPHPDSLVGAGFRERGVWFNADVEMALFNYASKNIRNQPYKQATKNQLKSAEALRVCPLCNSPLVERTARKTGEHYLGCTNFDGGCRYHERSY